MEYKLFEEFITLQALLKDLGIIQSGGAIKAFLAEQTVYFNGELETRRGKKIRLGDRIELPNQGMVIEIVAPNHEEVNQYKEEQDEKRRVAQLVKKMNQTNKQQLKKPVATKPQKNQIKPAVRFPGT